MNKFSIVTIVAKKFKGTVLYNEHYTSVYTFYIDCDYKMDINLLSLLHLTKQMIYRNEFPICVLERYVTRVEQEINDSDEKIIFRSNNYE